MVATVKKLTGRQYLRIGQSFYDVGNLKLLVLGRVDVEMVATKLFIEINYLFGHEFYEDYELTNFTINPKPLPEWMLADVKLDFRGRAEDNRFVLNPELHVEVNGYYELVKTNGTTFLKVRNVLFEAEQIDIGVFKISAVHVMCNVLMASEVSALSRLISIKQYSNIEA